MIALPFRLIGALCAAASADAFEPVGRVEGTVTLGVAAGARRDLSDVLVFLVPRGREVPAAPISARARISQRNAKFLPSFLVVPKGQTVEFPNDDAVEHNVFSFSESKRFDLGLYVHPESRSVTFEKEGPVFLFCSIHEWMSGVVYVAPNGLFGVTAEDGSFKIDDVPAGRYMAYTWNVSLPSAVRALEVREVDVKAGRATRLSIELTEDMKAAR